MTIFGRHEVTSFGWVWQYLLFLCTLYSRINVYTRLFGSIEYVPKSVAYNRDGILINKSGFWVCLPIYEMCFKTCFYFNIGKLFSFVQGLQNNSSLLQNHTILSKSFEMCGFHEVLSKFLTMGPSINDVGPFFQIWDHPPSPYQLRLLNRLM